MMTRLVTSDDSGGESYPAKGGLIKVYSIQEVTLFGRLTTEEDGILLGVAGAAGGEYWSLSLSDGSDADASKV